MPSHYVHSRDKVHHERKQKALKHILSALKEWEGCADCGFIADPAALDFDHVRGEKRFNLGGNASMSWAAIRAEVQKCEVVCANCHRTRTRLRREAESCPI